MEHSLFENLICHASIHDYKKLTPVASNKNSTQIKPWNISQIQICLNMQFINIEPWRMVAFKLNTPKIEKKKNPNV
jgi:hypothetical protein